LPGTGRSQNLELPGDVPWFAAILPNVELSGVLGRDVLKLPYYYFYQLVYIIITKIATGLWVFG
jgi:hypothetical protein